MNTTNTTTSKTDWDALPTVKAYFKDRARVEKDVVDLTHAICDAIAAHGRNHDYPGGVINLAAARAFAFYAMVCTNDAAPAARAETFAAMALEAAEEFQRMLALAAVNPVLVALDAMERAKSKARADKPAAPAGAPTPNMKPSTGRPLYPWAH